jgi:hypothetical protein
VAASVERYEIDILDGSDVVRTLTATSPAATYSSADQTTDFGAPQSSVSLRLYQLSATRGRGTPPAPPCCSAHRAPFFPLSPLFAGRGSG